MSAIAVRPADTRAISRKINQVRLWQGTDGETPRRGRLSEMLDSERTYSGERCTFNLMQCPTAWTDGGATGRAGTYFLDLRRVTAS